MQCYWLCADVDEGSQSPRESRSALRQLDVFQFVEVVSLLIQQASSVLTNWRGSTDVTPRPVSGLCVNTDVLDSNAFAVFFFLFVFFFFPEGDLPPRRLHTWLHAGEIPNLVSWESRTTFLCWLSQLVETGCACVCMYEMFERGCVRASLLWSLCVYPLHSDEPLSPNCFNTHLIPYLFVDSLSSYMVMPFVAQDLGHIMKRRRLTDRIITYLFYQLLRGLKVRLLFFVLNPIVVSANVLLSWVLKSSQTLPKLFNPREICRLISGQFHFKMNPLCSSPLHYSRSLL